MHTCSYTNFNSIRRHEEPLSSFAVTANDGENIVSSVEKKSRNTSNNSVNPSCKDKHVYVRKGCIH